MSGFVTKEVPLPSTVKLIHGDCLDVLKTLRKEKRDAVVTDPPYGIDLDTEYGALKSNGRMKNKHGGKHRIGQKHIKVEGDQETFNPLPWMEFPDCILWGCNHYCHSIPEHEGQWYFWDKVTKNDLNVRIAEGEFAWHKKGTKPRAFRHLWSGAYRWSENGQRSKHPCQKPVELMKWCLSFLPEGCTVLDPFMGSGTTGVACVMTGRNFIGIEIDEDYFKIAERRIKGAPRRA